MNTNDTRDNLELQIDLGRMLREVEAKMRRSQTGDAFAELEGGKPLLTGLVPDGMVNLIRKTAPDAKPTLRRKAVR